MWFPEREEEGDIGKVLLSNCDSLARESCGIWLRMHLRYQRYWGAQILTVLSLLLMLLYHTQTNSLGGQVGLVKKGRNWKRLESGLRNLPVEE